MEESKYDAEKRSRALRSAALRLVVAVYIGYLAYKIAAAEDTTMNITVARIIGSVFMTAAVAFGIYSFVRMRSELAAARISPEGSAETDGESRDGE